MKTFKFVNYLNLMHDIEYMVQKLKKSKKSINSLKVHVLVLRG